MSETLVFVLLMGIGFVGLTVGLQPLLWSTRTPALSWEPPAFYNSQVMQFPAVRVKRVPAPVPVNVRRVWLEERSL